MIYLHKNQNFEDTPKPANKGTTWGFFLVRYLGNSVISNNLFAGFRY